MFDFGKALCLSPLTHIAYNKTISSIMMSKSTPTERYTPPPEYSPRPFLMERVSLRKALFSRPLIPDLSKDCISANRSSMAFAAGAGGAGTPEFNDIGFSAVAPLDSNGLNVNNKHTVNRLTAIFFMSFLLMTYLFQ